MARIEDRLKATGLSLPAPAPPPAGRLPLAFVRLVGARAVMSGHGSAQIEGEVELSD